jgi:nucleotide-binding universal stress UspA family protein
VSAYLTEKWRLPLVIETVQNKQVTEEIAGQARTYLQQRNIQATFLEKAGDPAQIILDTARAEEISLIIMGGYGQNPLVEVVLGSVVDQILRTRDRPILICR